MRVFKIFFTILLLSSYLYSTPKALANKQILIINSYHKGFDWSDIVVEGIEGIFYQMPNISSNVLYMDSKRINSKEYYGKLRELYKLQLKNRKYDLVIAIDTFAYNFILRNYHELFTNEPILFSGPESVDVQKIIDLGLQDRVYGILEQRAVRENFSLIAKTLPKLQKLIIINDSSSNGDDTNPFIKKEIQRYKDRFDIEYIRDITLLELEELLKEPRADEAVLFIRFYNDKNGVLQKNNQIASMIDKSKLPVFVTDTLFFGKGAFGGKLVDIEKLGTKTGLMALDVLKKEIEPLHVKVFDEFIYGFDYEKIRAFSIYPKSNINDLYFINTPLSFFDRYRTLVNDMFLLSPFLILLIIGLIYNIYKRVQGEKKLKIYQEQQNKHQQFVIQQSKLAEIGEIFSSIAHQWKNPLVEISAIAQEHLYMGNQTNDNSYVDDIMVQVQYMSNTINDFQKFIAPSSEKTIFNIEKSIDTIMKIMAHTIKYNYIDIDIDKKEANNFLVCGYKNEFMQTLLNIFNNAKDQIQESRNEGLIKRGKLSIKIYNSNDYIILDIYDNGKGIAKGHLQRVFEPYFTTKKQGHGIGLYMTKLIIEDKMGGKVYARNYENGACFSIKLENAV